MTATRKLGGLLLLSLLAVILTGCPKQTTIADIKKDPARYENKEVSLRGHVTQAFGALGQGIYEIDDNTGRLWVLVESTGVPRQGAEGGTSGKLSFPARHSPMDPLQFPGNGRR